MARQLGRDSFGRRTLMRVDCDTAKGRGSDRMPHSIRSGEWSMTPECGWCGLVNAGRLYHYRWEHDSVISQGEKWSLAYCSVGCWRTGTGG